MVRQGGTCRRSSELWRARGNTPKASGMAMKVNAAVVQWSDVPLPGEPERSGDGRPEGARRVER